MGGEGITKTGSGKHRLAAPSKQGPLRRFKPATLSSQSARAAPSRRSSTPSPPPSPPLPRPSPRPESPRDPSATLDCTYDAPPPRPGPPQLWFRFSPHRPGCSYGALRAVVKATRESPRTDTRAPRATLAPRPRAPCGPRARGQRPILAGKAEERGAEPNRDARSARVSWKVRLRRALDVRRQSLRAGAQSLPDPCTASEVTSRPRPPPYRPPPSGDAP